MADTTHRLTDEKLEEMESGCLPFIPERKRKQANAGKSILLNRNLKLMNCKKPMNLQKRWRCKRRAYWKIRHLKNIAYAQAWVAPYGTNGAYMRDEIYKDSDGIIWKCKEDYCITDQKEHPSAWVKI